MGRRFSQNETQIGQEMKVRDDVISHQRFLSASRQRTNRSD